MDEKDFLDELIRETRRRRRTRTDLSPFSEKLKEMMNLDISLPVILEWLEKQQFKTTLPALRRFVVRTFGEDFYHDFLKRNGWLKTKYKTSARAANPEPASQPAQAPKPSNTQEEPAKNTQLGVVSEQSMGNNPLRALSGEKKPGEFNPIPPAKIEFD